MTDLNIHHGQEYSLLRWVLIIVVLASVSCSPHSPTQYERPEVEAPQSYIQAAGISSSEKAPEHWWQAFHDDKLNMLVNRALHENFTLKAAWARLEQARERAVVAGSAAYPQVNVSGGGERTRIDNDESGFSSSTGGFLPGGDGEGFKTIDNNFFVRSGLSFEVDLWQRIASQTRAEEFRSKASAADVDVTALLLAGSVTELWFQAQEQQALLNLLREQLAASAKQLELIELRFSVGSGNALDVLQQRQQVASTRVEIPIVERALTESVLQLAVVVGALPGQLGPQKPDGKLPAMPPFPELVKPVDLLRYRPDLRVAQLELQGADFDLASAVAERYPRLTLGLSYEFSSDEIGSGFSQEIGRMVGDALFPLIDGGRRRAQVRGREARVQELLHDYTHLFLTSLRDVEGALAAERHQKELLERLSQQLSFARATLQESKSRYVNGLTDYLNVLVALQGVQVLERRMVSERRDLLVARSRLYRSMGGPRVSQFSTDQALAFRALPGQSENA